MEAKIVVLLDKGPELSRPEFSGFERSEKFVGIDRVRLEFQDERFNVGGGGLNGAHATHTKNGLSPIITMTEARLHDAPGPSQGNKEAVVTTLTDRPSSPSFVTARSSLRGGYSRTMPLEAGRLQHLAFTQVDKYSWH